MEIELKMLVDPEDIAKLRKHRLLEQLAVGQPVQADMEATYFDTPDFRLLRGGAGLRVRRSGTSWTQTMKAGGSVSGGLHQRNEWEGPVEDGKPDLEKLKEMLGSASGWTKMVGEAGFAEALAPIFKVNVRRTTWDLRYGADAIELVLDEGSIAHGDETIPVSEIELELKSGMPRRLYALALELLADVPLRLSNASKAERGYALAMARRQAPVKARDIVLPPHVALEDGLKAVVGNCLEQIQGNEQAVIDGGGPEYLHQMRVGVRRLRSALRMFEQVAPCPADLMAELQWIGGQLGAARDREVLAGSTLPRLTQEADAPAGPEGLQAALAAGIAGARAEASAVLRSARYTTFLVRFLMWIEGAQWRDSLLPADLPRLNEALGDFARKAIIKSHKRMLKRGRHLDETRAEELHRLRIAGKRNRYAVEFFASLFPAKRTKAYRKALTALQDLLGWRNDMTVGAGLLQQLEETQPGQARDAAFFRGYLAASGKQHDPRLRKAWKRFRKTRLPFNM